MCSDDAAPGELSADVLAVIFLRRADSTARIAAIKGVGGQLLGPDIAGEGPHFVRVPSGGSEARLQALADRMIRMKPVSEVGPVPCPGRQQPVDTTRQKR
ncbi:MAG TPA: hypothetical protein VFU46_04225 [Gemmatimonadales bacterium]|nr:hypothetical protein [Gemmatimonadales bacterium]